MASIFFDMQAELSMPALVLMLKIHFSLHTHILNIDAFFILPDPAKRMQGSFAYLGLIVMLVNSVRFALALLM